MIIDKGTDQEGEQDHEQRCCQDNRSRTEYQQEGKIKKSNIVKVIDQGTEYRAGGQDKEQRPWQGNRSKDRISRRRARSRIAILLR